MFDRQPHFCLGVIGGRSLTPANGQQPYTWDQNQPPYHGAPDRADSDQVRLPCEATELLDETPNL
jgi:hypothetical protein